MPMPTKFNEAPMLAALVAQGALPPVEDRLPKASDVLVIPPVDRIGDYGGTWRRAFTGPTDGQNADRLMTDMILEYDVNGTDIVPNLAKGWEVSSDGMTYTLFLREGMKWSDGVESTADDWVWYFDNVTKNETMNPERDGQIGWSGHKVDAVRKVDDYTVQIVLRVAAAGFLDQLATYRTGGYTLHGRIADGLFGPSHYLKTVHRDFATDKDAYDKKMKDAGFDSWPLYFKERGDPLRSKEVPVNSPWLMTSPITSNLYEWERNPYYYGVDPAGNQLPYMDRIQMQLTEDREVLNLRAIAGEIDFQHRHIEIAKVPVYLENAEQGNYKMRFWPTQGTESGFTANIAYGKGDVDYDVDPEIQSLLASKDFRVALSLGLDRDRMNEVVFLGLARPKQQTFMKGHPFYPGDEYDQKYVDQNVAEANRLLDGLGYDKKDADGLRVRKDGKGPVSMLLTWPENYFLDFQSVAELATEDWAKIGIKILLNPAAGDILSNMRTGNEHELVLYVGGQGGHRFPAQASEWFDIASAYHAWYAAGKDVNATSNPAAEPTEPYMKRLVELTDQAKNLRYSDRVANYVESQKLIIDNQLVIGLVGESGAFNGVIVMKNYFKNVLEIAPNVSSLQNPGIARPMQFFMEGGKNDSE